MSQQSGCGPSNMGYWQIRRKKQKICGQFAYGFVNVAK
ncbi:protein of unknown function [Pseudomonas sp. JV551A1]|uniref:Uncharacterized protein n=1 Tax=Pseudomonas inefficax TaxID=2078786 RepID=A0AAQ1P2K0_9PSED|nr:protein of unknown function [Pseudomonas sp. JV551A1]SPO58529.1 protein of unknown function [Pseudomonas inefficax]SPO58548.1 protein of unknown function [Pseudomonas inefficax]